MLATWIGIGVVQGGNYIYDPDAEALFARFTTPPTDQRKVLISNVIRYLKATSVWPKLDALYLTAAADAQSAQRNWVQDAYNLTPVSSPTFTADRGYAGDGVASYLNTNMTPSGGTKYQQNSAHLSAWSRDDLVSSSVIIGARDGANSRQSLIQPRIASSGISFNARINQDVNGTQFVNGNGSGLSTVSRMAAGSRAGYRNQTLLGTASDASTGVPTFPFFLGALNTAGVAGAFGTFQIAAASIGSGLTDQNAVDLSTAKTMYLQAVGAA